MGVAIIGDELAVVRSLAGRLEQRGTPVATIPSGSATRIEAGLQAAAESLGDIQAVVRLAIAGTQTVPAPLTATALDDWQARAERPLHDAFGFHQAVARFLAERGGRVIVVLPTTGLSGAADFTPLATATEGERSLAKAQARVSGAHGVTINCVAVSSSVLGPTERSLDRGGLPPEAVPAPDLDQLAELIAALCGPGFAGVTGQTIALDGGRWMAP